MKRMLSLLLVFLMLTGLTACGQEAPAETTIPQTETQAETQAATQPSTNPTESGPLLTVQRNLPQKEETLKFLETIPWLDQTTEYLMVDDIPAVISYRNDGGTDKPIYIVPHTSWGTKENSIEFMPTGVSDINALFLAFDVSGYGDSPRGKLEGDAALQSAAADIDKLLTYVSTLGIANTDRIIIEGIEMAADVALTYLEYGQFTPAIVTLSQPSLTVGEYPNTQVLLDVDFDVRNTTYADFESRKTAVENPKVTATVQEGTYEAPAVDETAPAAIPETTAPPAPETTVPETTVPETTLPAPPASTGKVLQFSLTVERNLPMADDITGGLPNSTKVEKLRVNDLCAIIAYQADGQKKPVFLYLHGSGGGKEDGYQFLEPIVRDVNGIFISVDMPYGGESTHVMRNLTGAEIICSAVPDIDNLFAFCSTIPEADLNNIYLHGMSGGAASALAYVSKGAFTPSLLTVTVPCFDFRTYGEGGPPYARFNVEGDSTPHMTDQQINAYMDEYNAYLHAERMMDTYVFAGIGLAGPPNAEMDGKQMEDKFKQMGKTDMDFRFYPDVDHNIPGEFYIASNQKMVDMRSGSKIVNPTVQVNITEK